MPEMRTSEESNATRLRAAALKVWGDRDAIECTRLRNLFFDTFHVKAGEVYPCGEIRFGRYRFWLHADWEGQPCWEFSAADWGGPYPVYSLADVGCIIEWAEAQETTKVPG